MNSTYAMVIDDPANFDLLTEDLQRRVIKAAAKTVNIQAAQTRKNAIENIKTQFHQRNDFTVRNIRFTSCPESVTRLEDVQSEVGATERAGYMELQETGGIRQPRKGGLLNIPTDAAREGSSFAGKVTPESSVKGIKKRKLKGRYQHNYSSAKARAVARAYVAYKHKFVVHYGKNVFEITSFRKSGDNINFEKKLIRNLNKQSAVVKPKPWLEPAAQKPKEECQQIFNSVMDKIDG